jgi:hypothetical protein
MRLFLTATATAVAVLSSSGCYVASLAPYYSDGQVLLDPQLPGTWVVGDREIWTISRAQRPPNAYTIHIFEGRAVSPSGEESWDSKSTFTARIFKMDGSLFLDATPDRSPSCGMGDLWWAVRGPMHFLARISRDGDVLRLQEIDAEKLDATLHASRTTVLPHLHLDEDDELYPAGGRSVGNVVLTGHTTEIQAFLRRYLKAVLSEDEAVLHRRH